MVKIFFAGSEAFLDVISETNARALINFYYIKNKKDIFSLKKNNNIKELFVDSGAFTAWTNNVTITVEEYCKFIKQMDADYFSVLDVIGDDKATFKNQKKMEELGTCPIPCFHYGDNFKYLEYYINHKYDLISLGGMVGKQTKILQPWLDKIFQMYPNQKFHGFGMTRIKLIERYPWYSVDSSSWIKFTASKRIYSYKYGEFYLGKDKQIAKLNIKNNKKLKEFLYHYNISNEDFYNIYKNILKANIYGYIEIEQLNNIPELYKQKTLF